MTEALEEVVTACRREIKSITERLGIAR